MSFHNFITDDILKVFILCIHVSSCAGPVSLIDIASSLEFGGSQI